MCKEGANLSEKSNNKRIVSIEIKNSPIIRAVFYFESPGQQPCDGACLHAQAHGYWTGYPYEQAAKRIANTGRLRQQSTFIYQRCLRKQISPFTDEKRKGES